MKIGREGLLAYIQLLEAAFRDRDRVATFEWKPQEIKQKHYEFSQHYTHFQVLPPDSDWNSSALQNALSLGLSPQMNNYLTNSDMLEGLPTLIMGCQEGGNQIRCKGTYSCALLHRLTCGNWVDVDSNVDSSDCRSRCIGQSIAKDLRLVARQLYQMGVTLPWTRKLPCCYIRQQNAEQVVPNRGGT